MADTKRVPRANGPLALLTPMPEEALRLREAMDGARPRLLAGLTAYEGTLAGVPCVLVQCGVGKVAAATAAQALCEAGFRGGVLVLGIAGGITAEVHLGDILIASQAVQHDLDPRPFFARSYVPHLDRSAFPADPALQTAAMDAANALAPALIARPGPLAGTPPRVFASTILTGDQVIGTRRRRQALSRDFPGALGVDMETAAVAQVCYQNGVPWGAVRIISDGLEDRIDPKKVLAYAATSATTFLRDLAAKVLEADRD